MKDLLAQLEFRVGGRGAASIAVATPSGRAGAWTPHAPREPAFLAYSITKTFTAAIILRLCDDGALALDDRLARWFPNIPGADEISIKQLLNHTSGTPDYGPLAAYHESVKTSPSHPWSFERFGAETFQKGLLFEPGRGWRYSNPGYMLLKSIAERVTAKSFRTVIDEMIAQPLRLQRTFAAEEVADLAGLAEAPSRYLSTDGSPRDTRMHYHPGWVSHGVIASTASEIVVFVEGLFAGRLISEDSLARMLDAVPIEPGDNSAYGLGIMADIDRRLPVGHNGGGPGYAASVFHDRERRATACVMAAIEDDFDAQGLVLEVLAQT